MKLDPTLSVDAFDALAADTESWRPTMEALAAKHAPGATLTLPDSGTVLVGLAGPVVIKLYPPVMCDHFRFESAALALLDGKLSVATPSLIAATEHEGWPYLVMSRLAGVSLEIRWPSYSERQRCDLLEQIGSLMAEVQAMPCASLRAHATTWVELAPVQHRGCRARQERTRLPTHLLDDLERFLSAGDAATDRGEVMLTGEYTPMNLLVEDDQLVGMYDFGDGLIGPAEYDFLGPLCFLAAGDRARCRALLSGLGSDVDSAYLLRLLLLHRYSNLRAQVAFDAWQTAPNLDAVAELIFP